MATQLTNYQCPACTGPLQFSGSSGRLECEYCESRFTVEEVETFYAAREEQAAQASETEETLSPQEETPWDFSDLSDDWGEDGANMKAYVCPSCGAELICEETTAATSCPYCGNPAVIPGQFAGSLKPDYVIPFRLSKEDAIRALKAHYKGKPFLPRSFAEENHIQEMKGIYVPFWLFDAVAAGDARYQATRTYVRRTADEEIRQTHHFHIYRAGSVAFERIPVDASRKMPDDYMDSIEPYEYGELKPFSAGYLPGFLADKYDVTAQQSRERADLRCSNSLEAALRGTVGFYDTCIRVGGSSHLRRGKVHYALMPVWMLNTRWNGKNYLFVMNGQTGKMAGDLPVSWGRFWTLFAAISVPLSVLGSVLSILLLR